MLTICFMLLENNWLWIYLQTEEQCFKQEVHCHLHVLVQEDGRVLYKKCTAFCMYLLEWYQCFTEAVKTVFIVFVQGDGRVLYKNCSVFCMYLLGWYQCCTGAVKTVFIVFVQGEGRILYKKCSALFMCLFRRIRSRQPWKLPKRWTGMCGFYPNTASLLTCPAALPVTARHIQTMPAPQLTQHRMGPMATCRLAKVASCVCLSGHLLPFYRHPFWMYEACRSETLVSLDLTSLFAWFPAGQSVHVCRISCLK